MNIDIVVKPCVDSEDWVWSLLDEHGGVRMDGYAATETEAWRVAQQARREEIERLNEEAQP